jgi:NAD(P)-dependent dehydrogenase (short-subunit alcohol dehydrogenase family)
VGAVGGLGRPETIDQTAALIEAAGGRAIAVRVDHTREEEVGNLAARIRKETGRLDVLVNSIWGADSMIDWPRRFWEVDLARIRAYLDQTLISHVITCRHLAALMIEANRGLIVEVIDGHCAGYRGHILYDMVKAALARLAYGMAMELAQTGVTALSLSPGFLRSEAVLEHFGVSEENWRDAIAKDPYFAESESPGLVGRAVAALAADPQVRLKAGLIHFASDLAREYGFTDIDGRIPDFPRLFDANVEKLAATPPLNDEGRFYVWARYCQIHQDPARREFALQLARALGIADLGPGLAPAAMRT